MITKKHIPNLLYGLPVFIIACLSFTTEGGKHLISRTIVALTVISFIYYRENIKENLSCITIRKYIISLIAMASIFTIYTIVRGEPFSMPRTLYLSALYMIITPWSKVNLPLFKNIIIAGGVACGSLAIYERFFLGIDRVGAVVNQIPFATYAGMTLIIALCFYKKKNTITAHCLYLASIIGSLLAIILSETRGVWLAMIGLFALYFVQKMIRDFSLKALSVAISLLVISGVIFSSIPTVQQRFSETKHELTEIQSGNLNSSWGVRIQLWKTAIQAIESQPFFGVGTIGWKQLVDNNVKLGKLTATIGDYGFANSHAHNQFLDSYMRFGIIGIFISALFICMPLLTCNELENPCIKIYIPAFLLLCGLSDVPLFHTGLIYMIALYPFIIAINSKQQMER